MTNPVYRTKAWARLSKACLARDGYECQIGLPGCKVTATTADHIVGIEDGGEELPPLEGLRAACRSCNTAVANTARSRRARRYSESRVW